MMVSPERTPRQRILDVLTGRLMSARELAEHLDVSERQVEDHLNHLVKSVRRDRNKHFLLEPSECRECGFVYRERKRLTRPSRCPRCRSEAISPPRFGVEVSGLE